jgi:hypothetical protein
MLNFTSKLVFFEIFLGRVRGVLTRLCYAKSLAPCRGMGALAPMETAVLQPLNHSSLTRAAQSWQSIPSHRACRTGCSFVRHD